VKVNETSGEGRGPDRALIVDDEKNMRESLGAYLETEGWGYLLAASGEDAKDILAHERVDAVVVDLKMTGMSGLEFLSWLHDSGPAVPAIMISAHGDLQDAVEAMKRGASDYLVKPFDPGELELRLSKAVSDARLVTRATAATVGQPRGSVDPDWIGSSPAMLEIVKLVDRVAPTNSTVLVTGESGTGKEVVARLIHRRSSRPEGPFVPINLGGIPENLLESELFGYEKGAFTGADGRKTGLFELANGGTLFLDEIGDMPLPLQVKLLRVLQEKRIMRLGGTRPIPIDARIVAATNRELESAVRSGSFREDLFYRLNVIRLRLPALRDRAEDIPILATLFVDRFAAEMGKSELRLDGSALSRLGGYSFPGNVRELENAVERAVILCDGKVIGADDFSFAGAVSGPEIDAASPRLVTLDLRELERQAVVEALKRNDGHRERSAAALGITRRTLLNKMNEYGLS